MLHGPAGDLRGGGGLSVIVSVSKHKAPPLRLARMYRIRVHTSRYSYTKQSKQNKTKQNENKKTKHNKTKRNADLGTQISKLRVSARLRTRRHVTRTVSSPSRSGRPWVRSPCPASWRARRRACSRRSRPVADAAGGVRSVPGSWVKPCGTRLGIRDGGKGAVRLPKIRVLKRTFWLSTPIMYSR